MPDLIPADLSKVSMSKLQRLSDELQDGFRRARAADPPDIAVLEDYVASAKKVRAEMKRRPQEVSGRIVRTWPGWNRR